ncbi:hypothetical protein EDB94_1106 [Marinobacter sp. 3-2]|jgi:hypothetical protein|uniref:hypothetical protein n=1 Tax=Marinobacter sp. 3-2 TaxID=2485141 RepID=UPI000788C801|nr:hypothetical protein [Marinobacter sp. 3-2]ROQ47390.1 hypothetical protein EDB94_1106 [Marinobacter sp. 3-2]|tara:strand:- start:1733 stop:2146 length:414 start_codon:yes stop_codon:yes gene_type:complete
MIGDLIHRIEKAPMKFPKVTVVLVSAALLFVLWDQTREQPDPIDANRLTNLRANPVELSAAVDWIFTQIPDFCSDAAGEGSGTKVHADCVEKAEARTSTCRRMLYDRFPSVVASEATFRDVSLTAMACLVPRSGLVK